MSCSPYTSSDLSKPEDQSDLTVKHSVVKTKYNICRTNLNHNTYHHFQGQGQSDSELDVLLFSGSKEYQEKGFEIICNKENPLISSIGE